MSKNKQKLAKIYKKLSIQGFIDSSIKYYLSRKMYRPVDTDTCATPNYIIRQICEHCQWTLEILYDLFPFNPYFNTDHY